MADPAAPQRDGCLESPSESQHVNYGSYGESANRPETVDVPSWATRDQSHFFVLLDFYFRPLTLSEAFHVTDLDGMVRREGRITGEGVNCLSMREEGDDGELYTLVGATEGLKPGDSVVVEGALLESSDCVQGTTIGVVRVEVASRAR